MELDMDQSMPFRNAVTGGLLSAVLTKFAEPTVIALSSHVKAGVSRRFHFSLPFNINILMVVISVLVPLSATLLAVGWSAVDALETANIRLKVAMAEQNVAGLLVERLRAINALQREFASRSEIAEPPNGTDSDAIARWRILNTFIEPFSSLTAAYVGYKDGSFSQASVLTRDSVERQQEIDAPPRATRVLWLISMRGGRRLETQVFCDDAGNIVQWRVIVNGTYDPRNRPWYQAASQLHRQTLTDPYQFVQHGGTGVTAAIPLTNQNGVLAADFSLASLSTILREYRVSRSARMKVMTDHGDVLADSMIAPTATSVAIPGEGSEEELSRAMVRSVRDRSAKSTEREPERLEIGGKPYVILAQTLPRAADKNLFLTIAIPAKELRVESNALIKRTGILALVAIAAAIALVGLVSRTLARALERLAQQAQRFQRLDFSDSTAVRSRIIEISHLAHAIDRMRSGLDLFGRYIPKQIVRSLLESADAGKIGGVHRDVTVMFTDIEGFSAISEAIDPQELMARLSEYFKRIAGAIINNHGTVDKYVGDGIMAVWNAPDADDDHVANACRAALAILRASQELAEEWQQQGIPPFYTRVGIHRGIGVAGNVGSVDRMNYTVMGAVVNLASRIEGINKVYGTRVLASSRVYEVIPHEFIWRRIDRVVPVGTSEAQDIYELMADRADPETIPPFSERLVVAWEHAMSLYQSGNFAAAQRDFGRLCIRFPDDAASQVLAERCEAYEAGIPANWDGITRLVDK
jgi:adenylate cyclase